LNEILIILPIVITTTIGHPTTTTALEEIVEVHPHPLLADQDTTEEEEEAIDLEFISILYRKNVHGWNIADVNGTNVHRYSMLSRLLNKRHSKNYLKQHF
jgi:hypothetical protein